MQKLIIPSDVRFWKIIIKLPSIDYVPVDGEPIPGAEVILSQEPDDDSIRLENTGDIVMPTPAGTITYTFKN